MDDYKIKNNERYNNIFEKLVININQNDTQSFFSGMLAYAMYKQEKHEWAESYRKKHNTNNIPLSDLNNFLLIYNDEYLLRLKNSAELSLIRFAELYTEIAIDLAKDEIKNISIIKEIKRYREGWWKAGLKSALGSIIFTFFAFFISVVISIANPDSNYSKLIHFIIGGKKFVIQQVN